MESLVGPWVITAFMGQNNAQFGGMMIKEITGDILLTKCDAIAHGIAPGDDFKQGLALSLRENWPAMYKDFRHFCKTYSPKEGTLWTWNGAGSSAIINLFTQETSAQKGGPPGKASLKSVNHCLKELVKEVKAKGYKSLAITKLATGVGGLDWQDVRPLLDKHLVELEVPVYIYSTYQKDVCGE